MIAAALLLLLLAAPASAQVTLSSGAGDVLFFDPLEPANDPPGLEVHPSDPNIAFAAELFPTPAVEAIRIDPASPLGFAPAFPIFELPADLNGSDPASTAGAIIDDVRVESSTLAWVTTSDFESVVPFNPTTGNARPVQFQGAARLSVPTARTLSGAFLDSEGDPLVGFTTGFTSGVLLAGNRLLVCTSNLIDFTPPTGAPGTVLLFDVVNPAASPLVITPATPAYLVTSDFNPTALTPLPGGLVAVTNTGIIDFVQPPSNRPGPRTPGSVDLIDPVSARMVASIPLGLSNPTFSTLALDPTTSVALVGSASRRQLYAIDLRGIAALPVAAIDATVQRASCNDQPGPGGGACAPERVIRGPDDAITIPPAPGLGGVDGLVVQVRFGADGRFAAATELDDGLLAVVAFDDRNLATAHPLLPSRFGAAQRLVITPPISNPTAERGPGPLLLRASASGALAGTDAVWLTRAPDGSVMRGTLQGSLAVPTGNADADAVEDALDTCPWTAGPQTDTGRIGGSGADGVGNLCQCGDVDEDEDADVDDLDVLRFRRDLAELPPGVASAVKCDASADDLCDLLDVVRMVRALDGLPPGIAQRCDEP